jgi:hypothetical protein
VRVLRATLFESSKSCSQDNLLLGGRHANSIPQEPPMLLPIWGCSAGHRASWSELLNSCFPALFNQGYITKVLFCLDRHNFFLTPNRRAASVLAGSYFSSLFTIFVSRQMEVHVLFPLSRDRTALDLGLLCGQWPLGRVPLGFWLYHADASSQTLR